MYIKRWMLTELKLTCIVIYSYNNNLTPLFAGNQYKLLSRKHKVIQLYNVWETLKSNNNNNNNNNYNNNSNNNNRLSIKHDTGYSD